MTWPGSSKQIHSPVNENAEYVGMSNLFYRSLALLIRFITAAYGKQVGLLLGVCIRNRQVVET